MQVSGTVPGTPSCGEAKCCGPRWVYAGVGVDGHAEGRGRDRDKQAARTVAPTGRTHHSRETGTPAPLPAPPCAEITKGESLRDSRLSHVGSPAESLGGGSVTCPHCGSDRLAGESYDYGKCSQTGYDDSGERVRCLECGRCCEVEDLR